MKSNDYKICPFMSTPDKKVNCTKECALAKCNGTVNYECALTHIHEAIYELSQSVSDGLAALPKE